MDRKSNKWLALYNSWTYTFGTILTTFFLSSMAEIPQGKMASTPRVSGVEHRLATTSLNQSGNQSQLSSLPTLDELSTEVMILILKVLPEPVALNLLISSFPLFLQIV